MKEKELRELATCSFCDAKLFKNNYLPMFWKLNVSHYVLDPKAVQKQAGLEMMMGGNVGLAQVFSTNEDMAKEIGNKITLSMCIECMNKKYPQLHGILESKSTIKELEDDKL